MEPNVNNQPGTDQQEAAASESPPKENPKKVAGSLNPKQKTAFYEGVVKKAQKRRPN